MGFTTIFGTESKLIRSLDHGLRIMFARLSAARSARTAVGLLLR
jgi:hypothetical protein